METKAQLSRRLEPEAFQRRLVPPPAWPYLDAKLEIDRMPDDGFDLGPRAPPDLPDHRAALADHDLLLRLGLDEHVSLDDPFTELLHLHADRVGQFVFRQAQRLLADQLGDLHLDRKICSLLLREVQGPFGKQSDELLAKLVDPVTRLGTDRMEGMKVAEP